MNLKWLALALLFACVMSQATCLVPDQYLQIAGLITYVMHLTFSHSNRLLRGPNFFFSLNEFSQGVFRNFAAEPQYTWFPMTRNEC
jgi:hypothetical protein